MAVRFEFEAENQGAPPHFAISAGREYLLERWFQQGQRKLRLVEIYDVTPRVRPKIMNEIGLPSPHRPLQFDVRHAILIS